VGVPLGINFQSLLFTIVLSLATVLVFGLVPALETSRANVGQPLKDGRGISASISRHRWRNVLVILETVMAVVLLTGAGLLIRSLSEEVRTGPGFNTDKVLLTAMDLRGDGYSDDQSADFYAQLLDRIRTMPGVRSVTLERYVPLWFTGRSYTIPDISGYTPQPNEDMMIDMNAVGPDYFSTLEIPLVSGRDFTVEDNRNAPRVCIVNQTMAQHFWSGKSAIGQRVGTYDHWWTVVGVAKDVKYHTMSEHPEPFLYLPFFQDTGTDANILVKTTGDPMAILGSVRAQVRSIDPTASILEEDTLADLLQVSLFANRTAAAFATNLGLLGLILAAIGLYGVLSYSVGQRTHEIGVRMALGARPADVLRLVIGQGMRLALCGAVLGMIAALAAARLIQDLLFGVSPSDPMTLLVVAVILGIVALIACYLPARRAMRVDPMVALRYQ